MTCPVCHKNEAQASIYGIIPCKDCQTRRNNQQLPDRQIEFTPDYVKESRKEYAKSIIQPYRGGVLSKEYIDTFGTKGIRATEDEVKKAEYVWDDQPNMSNLKDTK